MGADDAAARFEAAHQELVAAVGELSSSQDWVRMLEVARRLPQYSGRNCLLLAAQGAQGMVMGYRAWQQIPAVGGGFCQVRKGATSLKVLGPLTRSFTETDGETGQESRVSRLVGFKLVSVFDQAALVAPPDVPDPAAPTLLEGQAPQQLWDALAAQITAAGFGLLTDPASGERIKPALGQTDFLARLVCVRPDLPQAQRAKTLAHELGHVVLHAPDVRPANLPRRVAEVEAESLAWLVTAPLGLDASDYSVPYISGWASGDTDLVLATADRVVTAARAISDAIHLHLNPADLGPAAPDPAAQEPVRADERPRPAPTDRTPTGPQPAAEIDGDWGVLDDQPSPAGIAAGHSRAASAGETSGETGGDVSGETPGELPRHPVAPPQDTVGLPLVDELVVDAPAGSWRLGWDQRLGSFTASFHPRALGGAAHLPAPVLGQRPGEVSSVGALEEHLGWPLPAPARAWLEDRQQAYPAVLPEGRDFSGLYRHPTASRAGLDGAPGPAGPTVDDPGVRPGRFSAVSIPGRSTVAFGAALDQDRPLQAWTSDGFTVAILGSRVSGQPPQQDVTYRISHAGQVMFSGDDVQAPLDADLHNDDALRQVVAQVCTPHPDIPLSAIQARFIDQHAPALIQAINPASPYPPGTRIRVWPPTTEPGTTGVTGAVTGTVVQGIAADPDGPVTSYAWRPDVAELAGHPWEGNPAHAMISAAEHVQASLAPPDTGLTGWTPQTPLAYGADVTFTADEHDNLGPDGSVRDDVLGTARATARATVSATVLRAYPSDDPVSGGIVYDLQPHAAGTEPIRLPAAELTPIAGTAWPSIRAIVDARDRTGITLRPGEVLNAGSQLAYTRHGDDGITLTRQPLTPALPPTARPTLTQPTAPPAAKAESVGVAAGRPSHIATVTQLLSGGHSEARIAQPDAAAAEEPAAPHAAPAGTACATPDCGSGAAVMMTATWPSGHREITSRCQPCTARVFAARMSTGCAVTTTPLTADPAAANGPRPSPASVPRPGQSASEFPATDPWRPDALDAGISIKRTDPTGQGLAPEVGPPDADPPAL